MIYYSNPSDDYFLCLVLLEKKTKNKLKHTEYKVPPHFLQGHNNKTKKPSPQKLTHTEIFIKLPLSYWTSHDVRSSPPLIFFIYGYQSNSRGFETTVI